MAYPDNYNYGHNGSRHRGTYHSTHGSYRRPSSHSRPAAQYPMVQYQNNHYRSNQQIIPYQGRYYNDSSYNTSAYYGNAYRNNASYGNPYYGNGFLADTYSGRSYPIVSHHDSSYYNSYYPSHYRSESYYPKSYTYTATSSRTTSDDMEGYSSMASGSLALGIIAVVCTIMHFFFLFEPVICYILLIAAMVCSIVGVALGSSSKKSLSRHHRPTGSATAGTVLSIIAISFASLFVLTYTLCIAKIIALGFGWDLLELR